MTEAVLGALGIYAALGAVFWLVLVLGLIGRMDEGARHGNLWFRLIILPGTLALWPYLALRLLFGFNFKG